MNRGSEYPVSETNQSRMESSVCRDCGSTAIRGISTSSGEPQPLDRPTGPLKILRVTGIGFAPKRTKHDSFGLLAYHEAQQKGKKD